MKVTPILSDSPISSDEVIRFCRLDVSERGLVEQTLIPAAIDLVESQTRRPFVRRTYTERFSEWPRDGRIYLSRGFVCRVEKIECLENETWEEKSVSDYETHLQTQSPWIQIPCDSCNCLTNRCGCRPQYQVTYSAGPEKCSIVPRAKLLLLELVCTMNSNRLADSEANLKETPIFRRLINSLKTPEGFVA